VQLVGRLSATAAVLPLDADAVTLGRVTLDPLQLRDAYRSGLTGTHYTVQIPIAVPPGQRDATATVKLEFVDGQTGQTRSAERSIPLRP
jgi:hypothetical protein